MTHQAAKRNMSSSTEAASERAANTFFECIKIQVGNKTYRVTNAPFELEFVAESGTPAETFNAFGQLVDFSDIEENATLEIQRLNITVSGIQTGEGSIDPVSDFLNLDYTHAPVSVFRVYTDENGYVGHFVIFKGYITSAAMQVDSGTTVSVTIDVANHWSDFDREAGRYTNDVSQQKFYPIDKGFNYSSEIQKEIKWKP